MHTEAERSSPRATVPKGPILSLQYLRAFAAMAVIAAHAGEVLIGQAGVDIFFVISGFIMWVTISKNPSSLSFIKNRIIRIVPLYWIATVAMGAHQRAGIAAVVKSMLFIPFFGEQGKIWPVLVQGWTLNYEMFFYLLIALVLLLPAARRLPAIVVMLASLSLCGLFSDGSNPVIATYTNTLALEFLFGVGLAELWFRGWMPRPAAIVPLASVGVSLACVFASDALPTAERFVVWGVPSALLVAAALSLEKSALVPNIRLLLIVGDASYAIYLFHTFFLKTVIHVVNSPLPGVNLAAVIAVASIAGVAITRLVERPCLMYLRSHMRAAPAA